MRNMAIGGAAIAVVAIFTADFSSPFSPERGFIVLFAAVFGLAASRQWIAEIDLRARTLRISRCFFGRWRKTKVYCSFDECRHIGRIEYESEGHFTYGVYVELKDGTRHAFPVQDTTFPEAERVAARISELLELPKLDTRS